MTKAAAYLRVSTGQQTTDNQLPAVRDWVTAHGHELTEVYQENESAWRNGHQPELARLLSDLRTGKRKYDAVVVWSLDRLTRAGIGEIVTLVNSFKACGCRVVSIQESWTQQDGYVTELLYAIFGWIAKFESDRKSERVLAGLVRARAQGKRLGRPPGSRDGKPRHRSGYLQRWAGKNVVANASHHGESNVVANAGHYVVANARHYNEANVVTKVSTTERTVAKCS